MSAGFAQKYWGHDNPLGRRVRIFNPAQPQPWRTIVGVVPDTLMQGPFNQQTDNTGFYIPILGVPPSPQFVTIVVRPHPGQSADSLAAPLGKAVAALDANLPTYFGGTPAQLHDEILGVNRITANLFTIFGIAAVFLSAVGLYGVMSFSVNQRTQEFGIRMALGADARRILRLVMTQGAWQLAIGLVLGVGRGSASTRRACRGRVAKHSLQGERARSVDLLRRRSIADCGCRRVLLRAGASRHARESDRRAPR